MTKISSKKNISASQDALAFWIPNRKEEQAIIERSHLETIVQIDEIWERLKVQCGNTVAVDSPHSYPQRVLLIGNSQKIFLRQHFLSLGWGWNLTM